VDTYFSLHNISEKERDLYLLHRLDPVTAQCVIRITLTHSRSRL